MLLEWVIGGLIGVFGHYITITTKSYNKKDGERVSNINTVSNTIPIVKREENLAACNVETVEKVVEKTEEPKPKKKKDLGDTLPLTEEEVMTINKIINSETPVVDDDTEKIKSIFTKEEKVEEVVEEVVEEEKVEEKVEEKPFHIVITEEDSENLAMNEYCRTQNLNWYPRVKTKNNIDRIASVVKIGTGTLFEYTIKGKKVIESLNAEDELLVEKICGEYQDKADIAYKQA